MSETNDTATRPAHSAKTLSLKKTETSTVKQSFSHGRTKAVVVEKKRARVLPGTKATEPGEKPKGTLPDAPANAGAARSGTTKRASKGFFMTFSWAGTLVVPPLIRVRVWCS